MPAYHTQQIVGPIEGGKEIKGGSERGGNEKWGKAK